MRSTPVPSPAEVSCRPHGNKPPRSERYRDILNAAFEEFSSRGYEATRLDDVAQRAGIAKGTVYLYFKNKEMLFRAVLRSQITHVLTDFEQFTRSSSASPEEMVRELLSRHYSHLVQNSKARSIVRLLVAESRKFPKLSEIYYKDMIEPGVRMIRLIVEKGVSSSEFSRTAMAEFPQLLLAPGVLAVLWTLLFGERHPLDLERYKEAHVQLVLRALRRISEREADTERVEQS